MHRRELEHALLANLKDELRSVFQDELESYTPVWQEDRCMECFLSDVQPSPALYPSNLESTYVQLFFFK